MNSISFFNFKIENGYFSCDFKDDLLSDMLEFRLNKEIPINHNLVAIALSTLCGRGTYKSISLALDISESTIMRIKDFTHSEVFCDSFNYPDLDGFESRNNICLNFSGGFDSLAAKYLIGSKAHLVSMDFGGKFDRERVFFENFSPFTVKTNILSTHLRKNSWSFMGIGSILYSQYLDIKYNVFGGILEASPSNFIKNPPAAKMLTFNPFQDAGMTNAPYVLGITEIGTAIIIASNNSELIANSLESVANNGEEKKYRKQLIIDIINRKYKLGLESINFNHPINKWNFGENFTSDFLAVYFLKNAERSLVLNMYNSIPDDVLNLAESLSLKFYERVNTNYLENFPQMLLPDLLKKLASFGILPYTEKDWSEFDLVVDLLRKYHNF